MMADRRPRVIADLDDEEGGLSFDESIARLSIEDELEALLDQQFVQ